MPGRRSAKTAAKRRVVRRLIPSARIKGHGGYAVSPRIYGSGNYITDAVKRYTRGMASKYASTAGSALGALAGNAIAPGIGGAIGGTVGGRLGDLAGKGIAKLTGYGDYNWVGAMNSGSPPPVFGNDTIRVKRRECIGHISATTAFTNNVFPINPGLSGTFPFLAAIANNYEQYWFHGLVFEFVSTASDAIASTTNLGMGQVILATDYNASAPPFIDDLQMLGSTFCNSGKPSVNIMHAVECANSQTAQRLYYVRSGSVPSGDDVRLYDLGQFQLATVNMPANYTGMGQLWVTYDVSFFKAVQNNQIGSNLKTDQFYSSTASDADTLGQENAFANSNNGLGGFITGTDKYNFPPFIESGYFLVIYTRGTSTVTIDAPQVVFTNCAPVSLVGNKPTSGFGVGWTVPTDLTVDGHYAVIFVARVTAPGAILTFTSSGPNAGVLPVSEMSLTVSQVNSSLWNGQVILP